MNCFVDFFFFFFFGGGGWGGWGVLFVCLGVNSNFPSVNKLRSTFLQ